MTVAQGASVTVAQGASVTVAQGVSGTHRDLVVVAGVTVARVTVTSL